MNKEFLPLDIKNPAPAFPFARIDADLFDELSRFCWKVSSRGLVSRAYYDGINSQAEGRRIVGTEHLAHRVLASLETPVAPAGRRAAPPVSWHPLNGDVLDLRVTNFAGLGLEVPPRVPAGDSFRELPEYAAALAARRATIRWMLPRLFRHRAGVLSPDQVEDFLHHLVRHKEQASGPMSALCELVHDRYGVFVGPSTLSRILTGDSLPVPGFDYTRVEAARNYRRNLRAARRAVQPSIST